MKLAEALQERADLNRKISELRNRLGNVILVQEGEDPVEDPTDLISELNNSINRLEYLMATINHTNDQTKVEGMTLTQIIAKKDALGVKVSAYKDMVYTAGRNTDRARGTEIKVKSTVKASVLQKEVDEVAKQIRWLDNLLQQTNWTQELME